MAKLNFAEEYQVVPILPPQDILLTGTGTDYVKMSSIGQGQLEIEIFAGNLGATDSTGNLLVTVQTSTSGDSDATADIAFNYRLSAAIGTNTWGTITAATSAGIAMVSSTADNMMMLIYVDPAVAGAEYVKAYLQPSTDSTATMVSAVARFIPRYAQNAQIDSGST